MKFKFRLEKVLKHRKRIEDLKKKDFAEAMGVLNREKEVLSQMQNQISSTRMSINELMKDGGRAAPMLINLNDFINGQKHRITDQKDIISKLEEVVSLKRQELVEARKAVKSLEVIREKKKSEFLKLKKKKEQKFFDEISSRSAARRES